MFNKVYWDKARIPALVLFAASAVCSIIQEYFLDNRFPGMGYILATIVPSMLLVQFLAYLSGRTLVDPDKQGNGGIWNNYICWIFFEVICTFVVMYTKLVIYGGE